jgi:hypothetical protein
VRISAGPARVSNDSQTARLFQHDRLLGRLRIIEAQKHCLEGPHARFLSPSAQSVFPWVSTGMSGLMGAPMVILFRLRCTLRRPQICRASCVLSSNSRNSVKSQGRREFTPKPLKREAEAVEARRSSQLLNSATSPTKNSRSIAWSLILSTNHSRGSRGGVRQC